jgi:hypothetical protein
MAKWIQKATKKMEQKGTVGTFSAAAKRAGKSTGAYATQVLKPGSKASAKMRKKAQFAKNVAGGNTMLPASHPKAQALIEGRKSNLATKCEFTD